MRHIFRNFAYLASAIFVTSMAQAQVAQITLDSAVPEENAQERINYSGKLRMLSQRIPSATCHVQRGIEVEAATALLEDATAEFGQILSALEIGDIDLNIIEPETRRKSLARIHELREKWEPFRDAADAVVAGAATDAQVSYLLNESVSVLEAAQLVVEELVQQYSNPNAVTQASLMLIDVSGRQRMLTQKMSKQACMIGSNYETDDTRSSLDGTARIFEASLQALRFGMPEVGIGQPPNSEIADGLIGVLEDWTSVKSLISEVQTDGILASEDRAIAFTALNTTMVNMNKVVGMYTGAVGPSS